MSTNKIRKVKGLCQEILNTVIASINDNFDELPIHLKTIAEEKIITFETDISKLIEEKERKNESINSTAVSQANLKGRQQIIEVTDNIVTDLLDEGYENTLRQYKDNPGGDFIFTLAIEGILNLEKSRPLEQNTSFSIQLTKESIDALPDNFLDSIKKTVNASRKGEIHIEFSNDLSTEPGVRIWTDDKRACYDNTIKDRFRRCHENLFSTVKHLLKSEALNEPEN